MNNDAASLIPDSRTIPLARLAQLALLLGAGLASLATGVALRMIRHQANNVDWVSHTLEVRQKLAVLRATQRGAASGIRVYLLTHTDSYLDDYRAAIATIPVELAELRQLTSDNPTEQANLAELGRLIDLRLKRLDLYVHGQEATVAWLDETKRNLDDIRQVADRIDTEEVRLLRLRTEHAQAGQLNAEIISSLGLFLSLALVGLGWWLSQLSQRRESELIQLLHVGSLVSNNASTFADALQACLDRVCEVTGWPGGHVHFLEGDHMTSHMTSGRIWRLPPGRNLHGLQDKLHGMRTTADIGIAGQLALLKRPGWIRLGPASRGTNPIRDAIAEAGFGGFLAVPVVAGNEVPAIVEFFLDKVSAPDSTLLEAIASIGAQLGRVYERAQVLELMQKHAEEIQALAITDELTGLLNRRGFIALAEQQLRVSARRRERCCLFFMDMDGLKAINDQLGHGEGDLALCILAESLQKTFREADLVARLGGDEFVALAVDTADAAVITNRIQQNLSGVTVGHLRRFAVSASVGTTWIEPGSTHTVEEALAVADAEMYARKRSRRAARGVVVKSSIESA